MVDYLFLIFIVQILEMLNAIDYYILILLMLNAIDYYILILLMLNAIDYYILILFDRTIENKNKQKQKFF